LIIDPSLVLLEQWKTAIEIDLGFEVTSSIGGNYVRRIDMGCTVTIGTVQSVAPIGNALRNFFKLIVADECHRYGAETFQHALLPDVRYRMGLTATLERSDNGVDEVLVPYFNRKVLSYDFGQARKDRVIAPYGVACIGVKLSSQEQFDYDEAGRNSGRSRWSLVQNYDYPNQFGQFIAKAQSASAYGDHEGVLARQFLSGIQRRKQIISETPAKQEVIPYIAAGIREASSTLVFCETKDAAETLSEQLNDQGVISMPYHSGLSTASRDEILEDLTSGWLNCVVAVRALDEGVDLPEVDCGVIISGTSQKRQMIQRMGRVLRKKSDERGTIFFIVYAKDTSEDPMLGDPDDGYISLVLNNAETYLEYDSDDLDQESLSNFVRGCIDTSEL